MIYNIRSVVLNGFRSITLVVGIAIATLCIVLGGSFQDAYDNLLEEKVPYAMLGGQYEYGFTSYQTENPYGGNAVFDVSFGAAQDDSRFNLIGYEEENDLADLKTEDGKALNYGSCYMTSSAAKQYGIRAGDTFSFYNTVTMKESTVVISGIVKNDILSLILTSKENAAEILERPVDEYNVIISKEKLTIPAELLKKASSLDGYRDRKVRKFVLSRRVCVRDGGLRAKMPESGDDGELKEHVGIVVLNEKKSRFLFRKKYMEYIVLSVKWV